MIFCESYLSPTNFMVLASVLFILCCFSVVLSSLISRLSPWWSLIQSQVYLWMIGLIIFFSGKIILWADSEGATPFIFLIPTDSVIVLAEEEKVSLSKRTGFLPTFLLKFQIQFNCLQYYWRILTHWIQSFHQQILSEFHIESIPCKNLQLPFD